LRTVTRGADLDLAAAHGHGQAVRFEESDHELGAANTDRRDRGGESIGLLAQLADRPGNRAQPALQQAEEAAFEALLARLRNMTQPVRR